MGGDSLIWGLPLNPESAISFPAEELDATNQFKLSIGCFGSLPVLRPYPVRWGEIRGVFLHGGAVLAYSKLIPTLFR